MRSSDSYFIEQLHVVVHLFLEQQHATAHVFTDDEHAEQIVQRFAQGCADIDITFSCREFGNKHDRNVLDDFFL